MVAIVTWMIRQAEPPPFVLESVLYAMLDLLGVEPSRVDVYQRLGLFGDACFAEVGHEVICIDNDKGKIESLQSGKIPIY